jgi:hypothetical protein
MLSNASHAAHTADAIEKESARATQEIWKIRRKKGAMVMERLPVVSF